MNELINLIAHETKAFNFFLIWENHEIVDSDRTLEQFGVGNDARIEMRSRGWKPAPYRPLKDLRKKDREA